jgi:hypothetical protein
MSRRTFKCNNIQQNVMSQTQNLKNPIKPKKNNRTQKTHRAGFFYIKKIPVFPNPENLASDQNYDQKGTTLIAGRILTDPEFGGLNVTHPRGSGTLLKIGTRTTGMNDTYQIS